MVALAGGLAFPDRSTVKTRTSSIAGDWRVITAPREEPGCTAKCQVAPWRAQTPQSQGSWPVEGFQVRRTPAEE